MKPAREPTVAEVIQEALEAMLDARDFLGLQLSHAQGTITDEAFEEHALPHLKRQIENEYGPSLVHRARVLAAVLPAGRLDADCLSILLRCDFLVAQQLVREIRLT